MGPFYNNRGMSVNILRATNTGNNTTAERDNNIGETVLYVVRAKQMHRTIGSLLPGNEAVNTHS
jgi:hypothetical protein